MFLFHHQERGVGGVTGLKYAGGSLLLDPRYPTITSFGSETGDNAYGERLMFDNGIWFMHYNAGSDPFEMSVDWPDRVRLAYRLSPYAAFENSSVNLDESSVYFARGAENEVDNGAIWQGAMFYVALSTTGPSASARGARQAHECRLDPARGVAPDDLNLARVVRASVCGEQVMEPRGRVEVIREAPRQVRLSATVHQAPLVTTDARLMKEGELINLK